jgi:hypothetical protein
VTLPEWADPLTLTFVGSVASVVVGTLLLLTTAERRHEPAALRRIHEPVVTRGTRRDLPRRFAPAPDVIGTTIVGGWGPQGAVGSEPAGSGDWEPGHGLPLVDAPMLDTPPPYSAHPVGMDVPIDDGRIVVDGHPGSFVVVPVVPVDDSTAERRRGLHLPILSPDLVSPDVDAFPTGHAGGPPPVDAPPLTSAAPPR